MKTANNSYTPQELASAKCQECGKSGCDDPLVISGKCHPQGGCHVEYDRKEHCLVLTCAKCKKFVVNIDLAAVN